MVRMSTINKNVVYTSLFLRAGLAAVFLYAAVSSLQHPLEWAGFLPGFLQHLAPRVTLVKIFAAYELALVLWLVIGKYVRYAGMLCALTLLGIVVMTPDQLIITFRDFGLICMGVALFFIES